MQKPGEFKFILHDKKKKQVSLWIHIFNPSTHDAEAGGSQVQRHYKLFGKILCQKDIKQKAMAILLKTENDGAWGWTITNYGPGPMSEAERMVTNFGDFVWKV